MNTSALITMATTHGVVILLLIYFSRKVLKTPPKVGEEAGKSEED